MSAENDRRLSRDDYIAILQKCETKADLVALITRLLTEVRRGSFSA